MFSQRLDQVDDDAKVFLKAMYANPVFNRERIEGQLKDETNA